MKALTTSLGVLVLAALFTGCTDNRQTFYVRDIKYPSEEECIVQSDRNAPFRPYGRMDLAFGGNFFLHPLVENAMTSSTKLNPVTAESNLITITGAEVRLQFEDGESIQDAFFVATSATVDPGSVVATTFEAIPPGYLSTEDAGRVILVEFRVLGTTAGGNEVDTPWFTFPVLTCAGCLAYFPPEAWDEESGCFDCCDIGSGGEMVIPCNLGQDERVDCRICASSHPTLCQDTRCPCS
jgi:hypothetical protein